MNLIWFRSGKKGRIKRLGYVNATSTRPLESVKAGLANVICEQEM